MKKWLKSLIVLFICCLAVFFLTDILKQKWPQKESNAAQQIVLGYYREEPNTIDVLALGASTVRNGLSPLSMFHDYGFTTYSRATSLQLPMISYHLLLETLENHTIKAVIMDASGLTNALLNGCSKETLAGKIHEAVDYMPWSTHKSEIISDAIKMGFPVSAEEFRFPLMTYHDRWSHLNQDDFIYQEWQNDYCFRGQNPIIEAANYSVDPQYITDYEKESNNAWLDPAANMYYKLMIEECEKRDIQFILVKMPAARDPEGNHQIVQAFADNHHIPFLDFNMPELQDKIRFNPQTDYTDSGEHLNVTGAEKTSNYIGQYIKSLCTLEDKREQELYSAWEDDYQYYQYLTEDAEVAHEQNLVSYLGKINTAGYIVMMATRNDTALHYNDDIAKAFETLGIYAPFGETEYLSYSVILNDGKIVTQMQDENPYDEDYSVQCQATVDHHNICVLSQATKLYSQAQIDFDGKSYGTNSSGFNFVVYDKRIGQVISEKTFRTGIKGANYKRSNPLTENANDPVRFLELLDNEDYITVIGAAMSGSRYMPGTVNDQLSEIGLIPLDKEINRPYIAILNGSEIIYNEYGQPETEIMKKCTVAGTEVTVVSNTKTKDAHFYVAIGDEEPVTIKSSEYEGLVFYIYSKSAQKRSVYKRYKWSENYLSPQSVSGMNNALELLSTAQKNHYDVFCIKIGKEDIQTSAYLQSVSEYGFDDIKTDGVYAGAVLSDGNRKTVASDENAEIVLQSGETRIELFAGEERGEAVFNGVSYSMMKTGLYLFLFDPVQRAVLTQVYYP